METKYLIEDRGTEPPMRRPVPVLDRRPVRARRSAESAAPAGAGAQPRAFEDLPWRTGYRIRRFVMTIWGPPQLDDDHDPLVRLSRQRAQRYAGRARRAEADA